VTCDQKATADESTITHICLWQHDISARRAIAFYSNGTWRTSGENCRAFERRGLAAARRADRRLNGGELVSKSCRRNRSVPERARTGRPSDAGIIEARPADFLERIDIAQSMITGRCINFCSCFQIERAPRLTSSTGQRLANVAYGSKASL
jgi:hypothetical protein